MQLVHFALRLKSFSDYVSDSSAVLTLTLKMISTSLSPLGCAYDRKDRVVLTSGHEFSFKVKLPP